MLLDSLPPGEADGHLQPVCCLRVFLSARARAHTHTHTHTHTHKPPAAVHALNLGAHPLTPPSPSSHRDAAQTTIK